MNRNANINESHLNIHIFELKGIESLLQDSPFNYISLII